MLIIFTWLIIHAMLFFALSTLGTSMAFAQQPPPDYKDLLREAITREDQCNLNHLTLAQTKMLLISGEVQILQAENAALKKEVESLKKPPKPPIEAPVKEP